MQAVGHLQIDLSWKSAPFIVGKKLRAPGLQFCNFECDGHWTDRNVKFSEMVKVKIILEQATNAQRGSRGIAPLFL
jgi:hypothetical protein